jgi:hypothetical protein
MKTLEIVTAYVRGARLRILETVKCTTGLLVDES